VLVPEIALAPQTVGRFRQRFGDRVAIVHSSLGDAERRDERDRIARGEARIVVGARSAVFAPMRGVGLIVVDEEHDASYKQESDPRYDARTVAAKRAALEGAVAVYGSATPRPESWARLRRLSLPRGSGSDAVRAARSTCAVGGLPARRRCSALGGLTDGGGRASYLNRRGVAPAILPRLRVSRRCELHVALTLHTDVRSTVTIAGVSRPAAQLPRV
jgi:primosomal protein N' (replication factor Y)